jgi:hypothetical protein
VDEHPLMEAANMPDINQTATLEAKGTIRLLKLNRETLREMDSGGFGTGPTQGGQCFSNRCTRKCDSYNHCTRGCG